MAELVVTKPSEFPALPTKPTTGDLFIVERSGSGYKLPITELISPWTNTIFTTKITNMPGDWSATNRWRRVGSNIELHLNYVLTGAVTGNATLSMASLLAELGLSVDFSHLNLACYSRIGTTHRVGVYKTGSELVNYDGTAFSATNPATWANNSVVEIIGSVQIDEWS